MEKSIFEKMGGTYHQEGDYLLPDITVPESVSVGIWGQWHLRYIREHHKALYIGLQLSGELDSYLANIDQQAEEMFSQLVKQMAEQEGITEQFKAESQMEWVCQMNNIRSRATGIVNSELIFL